MDKLAHNQKGAIPLLVLIAVIGLISFFAISSTFPFKEKTLQTLYPRDESQAATFLTNCWPDIIPVGAIAGQPKPIWCYGDLTKGVTDTHVEGTNSWLDNFEHGASFGEFLDGQGGYKIFEGGPGGLARASGYYKTQHWRHSNHWMTDVAPNSPTERGSGGITMMRPDKGFTFENGKLVVEVDVAAGVQQYDALDEVWPEFTISDWHQPTKSVDDIYAYGQFGDHWAIGCRLDPERYFICDLKNNRLTDIAPDGSDHYTQEYQINPNGVLIKPLGLRASTASNPQSTGGYNPSPPVWRYCQNTDPDTNCRDRFRLELTRNTLTLFVNGVEYMKATGLPHLPDSMVNGTNYIYFADVVSIAGISQNAVRFHWDRIAVNPKDASGNLLPPSAPSDFCRNAPNGVCPVVATPSPTAQPTPSPTPATKIGDLNNDNAVNALDFAILLSKWGSSDPTADLNNDGSVGLVDFSILLSRWGT